MQKLKKKFGILLINFLSSCCVTEPRVNDLIQCQIDIKNEACNCKVYRHSSEYIGTVGQDFTRPLEFCDKIIGYKPDDYGELTKYKEEIRLLYNDNNCKGKCVK